MDFGTRLQVGTIVNCVVVALDIVGELRDDVSHAVVAVYRDTT